MPGSLSWIPLEDVIFHREIPETALIKDASVKLETVGTRECWFLLLTVQLQDTAPIHKPKYIAAVLLNTKVEYTGGSCATIADTAGNQNLVVIKTAPRLGMRKTKYFKPNKHKGIAPEFSGIYLNNNEKYNTKGLPALYPRNNRKCAKSTSR